MNNTSPLLRSAVIAMAMLTSGGTDATDAAAVGREHEHLTHITTSLDRYREPLLTLLAGLLRGGEGSTDGASLAEAVLEVSSGYPNATQPTVSRPFLARFPPFFLRCPASWRRDGENGRKMAENGRNLGEKRARNSGG